MLVLMSVHAWYDMSRSERYAARGLGELLTYRAKRSRGQERCRNGEIEYEQEK